MTLREARVQFTWYLALLVIKAHSLQLIPALAEGMDRKTPKDPTTDHMKGSLHEHGLAQDIDLYSQAGEYLSRTEDHVQLGQFWESLHPYCRWGGRFSDGNHYSFAPPELVGNRR